MMVYIQMMKIVDTVIMGHKVKIAFDDNSIHIFNAYQIKDDLKLRGYRFNPEDKSWFINPADINKELEVLNGGISEGSTDIGLSEKVVQEKAGGIDLPESYSVVQLRNSIEKALNEAIPGKIWLRGVIASEVKNYKWFSYFDLKDEDENIEIYFNVESRRSNIEKITEKLKNSGVSDLLEKDLPVFIQANLKVSSKTQIDVRLELLDILPEYTRAKIKSKLDITIDKLKEEKIFDLQKTLSIPKVVRDIALITSEQGTSIRDIMAGLNPDQKRFNIYFADSRMEGSNAITSVIKALDLLEGHPSLKFDCIILARGGGSEQSLSVFNEYELCRRVCLTNIPVITAIGHEKDLSAVELCSHTTPSPSTPSGIGKFLSQRSKFLSEDLGDLIGKIMLSFSTIQKGETEKVNSFLSHIPAILKTIVKSFRERLSFKVGQIEDNIFFTLNQAGSALNHYTESVIDRGMNVMINENERIKSVNEDIISQIKKKGAFENTILKKSILRIDLSGRIRELGTLRKDLSGKFKQILNIGSRILRTEETKVNMYKEYSEAGDPQKILERGFTLTLDEKNNPITSLSVFRDSKKKKLRFFDGEIFVEEKEE